VANFAERRLGEVRHGPGPAAQATEKPGRSREGGGTEAPGLTIARIVVPGRDRAYTPYGISSYAMWLLLEMNFGEYPFHALG
jgi:hypothetical protein